MLYAPENASAAIAMSGKPRRFVTAGPLGAICDCFSHAVAFSNWLSPPPPAFHATSPA